MEILYCISGWSSPDAVEILVDRVVIAIFLGCFQSLISSRLVHKPLALLLPMLTIKPCFFEEIQAHSFTFKVICKSQPIRIRLIFQRQFIGSRLLGVSHILEAIGKSSSRRLFTSIHLSTVNRHLVDNLYFKVRSHINV